METKFNIFDVTKSLALIAGVIFIGYHARLFIGKPAVIQPPIIIKIDDNAVKFAAMQASNETAEKLKKEFEADKSKILEAWKKDRRETKETLDELGKVNAELRQSVELLKRQSDKTYTNADNDLLNYDFKIIRAKDAKGEEFPMSWAMYYPNQVPEKRWKTGTYPLEFYTKIIETENPNGSFNRYAELTVENNQMRETKGKEFALKIKDIQWAKYEQSEKHFFWFNPRIGLSGLFTNELFAPSLDLSLSSYGKTTVDMDWRFLIVSAGITNEDTTEAVFGFMPLQWNFGKALPLINNAFVGPVIAWSDSEASYGISLSIPF